MMSDEREMRRCYETDPDNIVYQALVRLYQLHRASLYKDYAIPKKAVDNLKDFFARNHIKYLSGINILFSKEAKCFVVTFKNNSASFLLMIDASDKMFFHFKKAGCFYAVKGECSVESYLCNDVQSVLWEHHHNAQKRFIDVKKQCEEILDRLTPNHGLKMTILKDNKH